MANDPSSQAERQRKLQQVRDEVERELAQGATLSVSDWLVRHPDLEPELGVMLRGLIGSEASGSRIDETIDAHTNTVAANAPCLLYTSPSPRDRG